MSVDVHRTQQVTEIVLNRPERRNALDNATIEELTALLLEVDRDPQTRVVVLRGEGPAFCAGYDLSSAPPEPDVPRWRRQFAFENRMFWTVWELRVPVIAAVQGHAIGLGCDLASTATVTLAEESARFSMPEVRFEMAPSFLVLPWLGAAKRSAEFLLGGHAVSAAEAVELGIASRTVADGTALDEARALAGRLAKLPPESVAVAKAQWRGSIEAQGLRAGVQHATELASLIAAHESDESRMFSEVIRRDGLKAAFAWRDAYFAGELG